MIPVKKEPDGMAENCFGRVERCVFCNKRSLFWHEPTNNCVCESCAKTHKVSELHNWKKKERNRKSDVEAERLADCSLEPVHKQFFSDGEWLNFVDESHYENTKSAGYPIRYLYESPIEPVDENGWFGIVRVQRIFRLNYHNAASLMDHLCAVGVAEKKEHLFRFSGRIDSIENNVSLLIEVLEGLMSFQVANIDKFHNPDYDRAAKLIKKIKGENNGS